LGVSPFFEKKSHCHSVAAWIFKNSSHVPVPRFGPVSKPCSFKMFFTALRETDCRPSFLSFS
jgi:hypothetical protein